MSTRMAEYVTRREAAELAGVHINTVRLWERTGRVSTMKQDNGVVMIPRAEVDQIVEHRRESAMDDNARMAALEAENRVLREELEVVRGQFQQVLDRITQHASGTEEG